MDFKLLVLDIDDSLMAYGAKISIYTKEVIQAVYQKGIKIVLASGRMYPSIVQVAQELDIEVSALIALNGALVVNETRQLLWHSPIETDVALRFINENHRYATHFFFATSEHFYLDRQEPLFQDTKPFLVYHQDLKSLLEKEHLRIYEFGFYNVNPKSLSHIFINGKRHNQAYYIKTRGKITKLMQKNISKGRWVIRLANLWGIRREQIMAVGDETNDISMLRAAGTAIVPGNARQLVRQYADYITKSSAKDGVAQALEKFLL